MYLMNKSANIHLLSILRRQSLPAEFSVSGVYLPGGILLLLLLLPVFVLTDRALLRINFYQMMFHPSLIRMSIFVCIYSVCYVLFVG
ncbi:MAG: hypothetical protein CMI03_06300 [Oceanospirillaceae bacterium]|nr:hypothetical protein [Oceanospirillaceae bacterium]MBL35127.1 hypothetical protein [Oceanospirillaceae bacterium]MBS52342.1 hypothetical protein [Oceanospirillaceae bacterium]